jgi:hypothetical protein
MTVRSEIHRLGTAEQDVSRALEELLNQQNSEWGDATRLESVYSPLVWRQKRRAAINLAIKCLRDQVSTSQHRESGARTELPPQGRWSEYWIEAPRLRLKGRADLVERKGKKLTIRDLKSGRVLDKEGNVLPAITRQMHLYGLMAMEQWPELIPSLEVDGGISVNIEFSAEHREAIRHWLDALLSTIPAGDYVLANQLAVVSEGCRSCPFRSSCSTYLEEAPRRWPVIAEHLPLDTWGHLVDIKGSSDTACDLTLRDAADRTVKVFGLLKVHIQAVQAGDRLWLFGLRTKDRGNTLASSSHPRNFFELSDTDPYDRAWGVAVYSE